MPYDYPCWQNAGEDGGDDGPEDDALDPGNTVDQMQTRVEHEQLTWCVDAPTTQQAQGIKPPVMGSTGGEIFEDDPKAIHSGAKD